MTNAVSKNPLVNFARDFMTRIGDQKQVLNAEHPGARLTEEQMAFLRMILDHVASSFHISTDDMEYAPFDGIGGPFRFRALFGDGAEQMLEELNVVLAA